MKTQTMVLIGGAALAVVAVGAVAYAMQPAAKTPAAIPSGTPVSTLTTGQNYTVAALLPTGVADQTTLANQLSAAGWSNVNVVWFQGQGTLPAGITSPGTGGYVATATWNGAANSPVPAGVVAVAA